MAFTFLTEGEGCKDYIVAKKEYITLSDLEIWVRTETYQSIETMHRFPSHMESDM